MRAASENHRRRQRAKDRKWPKAYFLSQQAGITYTYHIRTTENGTVSFSCWTVRFHISPDWLWQESCWTQHRGEPWGADQGGHLSTFRSNSVVLKRSVYFCVPVQLRAGCSFVFLLQLFFFLYLLSIFIPLMVFSKNKWVVVGFI